MTAFRKRGLKRLAPVAAACVLALAACGGPEQTPEAKIRALVDDVEQAAESHDISVFRNHVADGYQDERGFNRQTVLRIIQGVLLRNRQIHLLSVVRNIDVDGSTARATVLVAMAGRPIESADALLNVRADLMRFDVDLVEKDGEWLARAVAWRRAEVNDFL